MKAIMQAKVVNNNRNRLENQSRFYQIIAKIGPKVVQTSTKNRSNIDQKSIKNRSNIVQNRSLTPSWRGLGAILALGATKRQKDRRKTAEKLSKTAQRGLQNRQNWRKNDIKI